MFVYIYFYLGKLFCRQFAVSIYEPEHKYTVLKLPLFNFGFLTSSIWNNFIFNIWKLIFWGLLLIFKKRITNFSFKIFFVTLYLIFGSLFFKLFGDSSFWLPDNGYGGFLGKYLMRSNTNRTLSIQNRNFVYLFSNRNFIFLSQPWVNIYELDELN